MHTDTFSAVRINGELLDWFETVMGVLQGCVLSPLLFNIFLEMVMRGLGGVVGLTLPMARADRGSRPVYYLPCSDLGQVINLLLLTVCSLDKRLLAVNSTPVKTCINVYVYCV